jgi:hypothetical protein
MCNSRSSIGGRPHIIVAAAEVNLVAPQASIAALGGTTGGVAHDGMNDVARHVVG